jgi:DNA-directed RNA polymerase
MENKKYLILNKDKRGEYTFEELAEMYNKVIVKEIKHWWNNYDADELYQEALIAMWEAYERYDVSKGVSFYNFAIKYIRGKLKKYNKVNNRTVDVSYSLDECFTYEEDAMQHDFSDEVIDKVFLEEELNKLKECEKQALVDTYCKGKTFKEVSKTQGVTNTCIEIRRKSGLKKIQESIRKANNYGGKQTGTGK